MSDLTYAEAQAALTRQAAMELGADYGDQVALEALSGQLVFLRNHMAAYEEPVTVGDSDVTMMVSWACDDEAAILLGRLADRGWKLVRADR